MRHPAQGAWVLLFTVMALMLATKLSEFSAGAYHPVALSAMTAGFLLLVAIMLPGAPRVVKYAALALQLVAVFAPPALMGAQWTPVYTMAGPAAAGVLLLVRPHRRWPLFTLVVMADGIISGLVLPDTPGWSVELQFALGDAGRGLILFALIRLAQLAYHVRRSGTELAELRIAQERLRIHRQLHGTVARQVSLAVSELRGLGSPPLRDDAPQRLTRVAELARMALAQARSGMEPPPADRSAAAPTTTENGVTDSGIGSTFARRVTIAVLALFGASAFASLLRSETTDPRVWAATVVFVALTAVLQLHHGAPRPEGSVPLAWPWTLGLHGLVITAGGVWLGFGQTSGALGLLAGAVLVRLRPRWSAVPVLGLCAGAAVWGYLASPGAPPGLYVNIAFSALFTAVAIYALCRLPDMTRELRTTREQSAEVAAALERARLHRDVHDRLGLHLSALSMRAELAARSLHDGRAQAAELLAELYTTAEQAVDDARTLAAAASDLLFTTELETAGSILRNADVEILTETASTALPTAVDHLLAVILREAATNILRHSRARHCTVTLRHTHDAVHLAITNDGVPPADSAPASRPGTGLANLTARTREHGGTLTTHTRHGTFTLTARIPAPQPAT
jgi:two-component system, NarL family, sensor histidine kinase DesK